MKVLQISPVAPPQRSGMANTAGEIHKATVAAGASADLVAAIGGSTVKNLKSRRIPGAGFLAFTPKLVSLCGEYDLIHLHYPCYGNAMMVARALRRFPKPLVVSYHMDTKGRGLRRPVFWLHRKLFAPRFLRRAVRIVVASRDYAEHSLLAEYPELMEKVVEIPFGVDAERFFPSANRPEGRNGILFVGSLDEQHYFKGLPVLMEALLSLPEAKLTVVGGGSLLEHYRKLAVRLGLHDRVYFAGRVSDEELPEHYRNADVYCGPSVDGSEAYGISIVEALASGIPAVATDIPGVRSVVKDGETGLLVKPNDAAALAVALKKILSDGDLRAKMGESARAFALTRSWQSAGEKYLEIYRQVLK